MYVFIYSITYFYLFICLFIYIQTYNSISSLVIYLWHQNILDRLFIRYDYDVGSGVVEAPQACPYLTSLALASLYTAGVASCRWNSRERHLVNPSQRNSPKPHEISWNHPIRSTTTLTNAAMTNVWAKCVNRGQAKRVEAQNEKPGCAPKSSRK